MGETDNMDKITECSRTHNAHSVNTDLSLTQPTNVLIHWVALWTKTPFCGYTGSAFIRI